MTPAQLKSLMKQYLQALELLHSKNVLHSDIRPENTLIDINNSKILIGDLKKSIWFNPEVD